MVKDGVHTSAIAVLSLYHVIAFVGPKLHNAHDACSLYTTQKNMCMKFTFYV